MVIRMRLTIVTTLLVSTLTAQPGYEDLDGYDFYDGRVGHQRCSVALTTAFACPSSHGIRLRLGRRRWPAPRRRLGFLRVATRAPLARTASHSSATASWRGWAKQVEQLSWAR